jgi:hypothetical protein
MNSNETQTPEMNENINAMEEHPDGNAEPIDVSTEENAEPIDVSTEENTEPLDVSTEENTKPIDVSTEENAEPMNEQKTSLQITIDKPLLTNLAQSLHVNLIITTNSYIQILQKLEELGESSVQEIIPQLTTIQEQLVQMLTNVQNQLHIEPEKREDPQKIIQNASHSDAITKNMLIVQSLFTALATLSPLLLGGERKRKKRKQSKNKRQKPHARKHKTTKKSSSTNI